MVFEVTGLSAPTGTGSRSPAVCRVTTACRTVRLPDWAGARSGEGSRSLYDVRQGRGINPSRTGSEGCGQLGPGFDEDDRGTRLQGGTRFERRERSSAAWMLCSVPVLNNLQGENDSSVGIWVDTGRVRKRIETRPCGLSTVGGVDNF